MDKTIYNVLNKIERKGYKAYIVGGYVRDMLLHRETKDVDIITNCPIDRLYKLFCDCKKYLNYMNIKFKNNSYNFSLTTFRKESKYVNNKPLKIESTNDLKSDLIRRDFTINTLCLDKQGIIYDYFNGTNDINNRVIKVLGNVENKFNEDNTRMLRALRFMSILDFNLEKKLNDFIINNKNLIEGINYVKKKQELDLIFNSTNYKKFLSYVKNNKLEKAFAIEINDIKDTYSYLGVWALLDFNNKYNFSKKERNVINNIKKIVTKKTIDLYDGYIYDKEVLLNAGKILGVDVTLLLKNDKNIKLNITIQEVSKILNIDDKKYLRKIMSDLLKKVIEGKVKNEYNYLIKDVRKWIK